MVIAKKLIRTSVRARIGCPFAIFIFIPELRLFRAGRKRPAPDSFADRFVGSVSPVGFRQGGSVPEPTPDPLTASN